VSVYMKSVRYLSFIYTPFCLLFLSSRLLPCPSIPWSSYVPSTQWNVPWQYFYCSSVINAVSLYIHKQRYFNLSLQYQIL
jgi:hypothetical protein